MIRSRGFAINGFFFDGRNGFFACEAIDFSAQRRDQYRKPNDPFGISLAFRRSHFNSILVPEQELSKDAVISNISRSLGPGESPCAHGECFFCVFPFLFVTEPINSRPRST